MSEADSDRSADRDPVEYYVESAKSRAAESGIGVGVAVVRSGYKDGHHLWECIVSDGNEWHYLDVVGEGLGQFEEFSPERIERGVEQFAAAEPAENRLQAVRNANPLHINEAAQVTGYGA
jgi:hypothetical protein